MAFEKKMAEVPPQPLLQDGAVDGVVKVPDTAFFKVKQEVTISGSTIPKLNLEVKRVLDEHTMILGPRRTSITDYTNLTLYTTDNGSVIFAPEQKRNLIPEQEVPVVTYEEEPTVAQRVIQVDKYGRRYDKENRIPVDPDGAQTRITNNLLAMQIAGIDPTIYLVNNDGFFIFNNEGDFIKAE